MQYLSDKISDLDVIRAIEIQCNIEIGFYNGFGIPLNHFYYHMPCHKTDPLYNRITVLKLNNVGLSNLVLISKLTELRELYLRNNEIDDISEISNLYNLTTLDLSSNKIKDINPLSNIKYLKRLSLNENNIHNISMLNIERGATIDLQYNKIKTLPKWIADHK